MSAQETQPNNQALQANDNAGLIEQRGHSMLLDYKRGVSFAIIATRYGCLPSDVEALVAKAQEDAILRNEHIQFKAEAMTELSMLARELAEMDTQTSLTEELEEEVLGNDNKVYKIKKPISHVQTKLRIKTERRNNVMSRIAISGAKTGEGNGTPESIPADDTEKIKQQLTTVASDIMRDFFTPVVNEVARANQEVGRLQASNTHTINITPECGVNDAPIPVIEQIEETSCESNEEIIMNCQSCGKTEAVIDLRNPANAQYMTLASPGETAVCKLCLDKRKASLSSGLSQASDFNTAEMR